MLPKPRIPSPRKKESTKPREQMPERIEDPQLHTVSQVPVVNPASKVPTYVGDGGRCPHSGS
ncbi:uncharacterized protein THITE_2116430 [Thermothielavioides terrestris NRRL 8126]|uniref:Uncharacterized protein n=1 Tax=Thermothielavioides terrestris (strain ATCC 38088 / NRRL 8126) TaxID=578455 RepID=G2R5V1_THETT|nr:uncharacterized protein THITE_2116430 [Thermothielavioides terrestris NRRL 8126]AEO67540.1 hypothetical protein THITE_2116430 [Thermothielavioides terrestris NRRL 8126]